MRARALLAALLMVGLLPAAQAQTETTIHTFLGRADGASPHGVTLASGALYVAAGPGTGRVFKFTPSGGAWAKTDIQHYNLALGAYPDTLIADATGALYGVTQEGGTGACINGNVAHPKVIGCGTVYKLTPPTVKNPAAKWIRTVLYNFTGGGDGQFPSGKLFRDASGALYGVTSPIPVTGPCSPTCGNIFQLAPPAVPGGAWTQRTLYTFTGDWINNRFDGDAPNGELVADSNGVLYGTTHFGGFSDGTVFSLAPPAAPGGNWTETVLYRFGSIFSPGGSQPWSGVILDANGALYGTATAGGPQDNRGSFTDSGVVYKLTPPAPGGAWTQSVVHAFRSVANAGDGCGPVGGLVADSTGQLFGTTTGCGGVGGGSAFRLTPSATPGNPWIETVLYSFTGGAPDSGQPKTTLAADGNGTLYGSASAGLGAGGQFGAIFAISGSGFVP